MVIAIRLYSSLKELRKQAFLGANKSACRELTPYANRREILSWLRGVRSEGANKNGRAGLFILSGEKQMTKTEIKEFKAILKAKQIELAQMMRNRDGIAIEKTPDALDETQLATERELATRNLERESKLLRSVRQALSRIEEGTYGLCLNCEEEISAKRLKALPWTSLCIHCQQQADDNRERVIEPRVSLLVNAA